MIERDFIVPPSSSRIMVVFFFKIARLHYEFAFFLPHFIFYIFYHLPSDENPSTILKIYKVRILKRPCLVISFAKMNPKNDPFSSFWQYAWRKKMQFWQNFAPFFWFSLPGGYYFHIIFHYIFSPLLFVPLPNRRKWAENGPRMATVNSSDNRTTIPLCYSLLDSQHL